MGSRLHRFALITLLPAVGLAAALGASGTGTQATTAGPAASPRRSQSPVRASAPVAGDLRVITLAEYRQILSVHSGRPVMVNFWATWCEPCRVEYPLVVELACKYMPQGLDVLGISLDDDADRNLVRHFLARTQPGFFNYRKKPGGDDEFIRAIDPQWTGAIPATAFYARDGHLMLLRIGEGSRARFEADIQEALKTQRK